MGPGVGVMGLLQLLWLYCLFPDTPFMMMLKTTSGAVNQLLRYPRGRTGELNMQTLDRQPQKAG